MDKQITLSLPLPVVNWLLELVDNQPRRVADPVFRLIFGQISAQVKPAPDAADASPGLTD